MDYDKINCIVCDCELDNWEYPGQQSIHPLSGLHFRTHGHYGSAIFDPMGEATHLDVAICDLCIMTKLQKVHGTGVKDLNDNFDTYHEAARSD